jgi:hypothetical protein
MDRHDEASIVTNNHYDQDGLVSIYALVEPDAALAARDLLIDVAAAGDFGTYRDRRAARIAWVLAAWATPGDTGDPFVPALERLPHLLAHVDEYRELWEPEDLVLTASEAAVAAGTVCIEDDPDLDLAVVQIDPDVGPWAGSRFVGQRFDGVHPMAVHNATDSSGVALVHGHRYQYTDRYETWVQYVSRVRRARVDLRPLANRLSALDEAEWRADAPGALAPTLAHDGRSSLSSATFLGELRDHLASAPPAWDPYAS